MSHNLMTAWRFVPERAAYLSSPRTISSGTSMLILRAGLSWGININTDAEDGEFFHEHAVFLKSPLFQLKERSVAVFTLFHQ